MKDNKLHFNLSDPLNKQDSETQTYGCRANNPDICKFCFVENICAFVRDDNICLRPSKKWNQYFKELKENQDD